jgi:chemotaxis protein MotA
MDFATLFGLALAGFILFISMVFDFHHFRFLFARAGLFFDVHGVLIVLGGTIGALMIAYPMEKILRMPKAILRVFLQAPQELIETLTLVVDVAKIARKNILAIEDALGSIDNPFMRNGLRLVVDRVDRELIIEILQSELRYLDLRRDEEIQLLKIGASLSPAFGLMGTLLGLILLLQNLSDPSSIGPAMGVAMTATFYGVILANIIFTPWATKLEAKKGDDRILREMIRDGILYIEKGERPDFIEQDLMNYLTPELRSAYEEMKFENAKGAT